MQSFVDPFAGSDNLSKIALASAAQAEISLFLLTLIF
jgi:hypothetical protein